MEILMNLLVEHLLVRQEPLDSQRLDSETHEAVKLNQSKKETC